MIHTSSQQPSVRSVPASSAPSDEHALAVERCRRGAHRIGRSLGHLFLLGVGATVASFVGTFSALWNV